MATKLIQNTHFVTEAEKVSVHVDDTLLIADNEDSGTVKKVKLSSLGSASLTDAEIKTKYENNPNTEVFTTNEKNKLSGLESSKYKGLFSDTASLPATGSAGEYADVDLGAGNDVERYIWDADDTAWVKQLGESASLTAAQVKTLYESNSDTNAFTNDDESKLDAIEEGAEVNDGLVKVSLNDTTPGVLNGKLVAGTNVTLTEGNDAGDETLTIDAADNSKFVDGTNPLDAVYGLGNVGIGTSVPETALHVEGAQTFGVSATPSDPIASTYVQWVASNGDVMMKINIGGTIKTITLVEFAAV